MVPIFLGPALSQIPQGPHILVVLSYLSKFRYLYLHPTESSSPQSTLIYTGLEQPEEPQHPGGKASYRPAKAVVPVESQEHPTPGILPQNWGLVDGFITQTVQKPSV